MALKTIPVINFDPGQLLTLARSLGPPLKTGIITPDQQFVDENNSIIYARCIWVGTTGDISFVQWDGTTRVLKNAVQGIWQWIAATMVTTANTTASNLVWGA